MLLRLYYTARLSTGEDETKQMLDDKCWKCKDLLVCLSKTIIVSYTTIIPEAFLCLFDFNFDISSFVVFATRSLH